MLKNFWKNLFVGDKPIGSTIELAREEHNVSRKKISPSALKVLYRLTEAGYDAYLVGGGVRDILLELSPKDFDIATNATPEEIKKLFRNCRLIGRRFRLAHILFGREIIEVATFRAAHKSSSNNHTSKQGLLIRDNVYGSLEEDAFRRDFTVNALYYSVKNFSVIDHVGGLSDLQKKQLRLIGDPDERYREDPVRMLRAIRLSVKLNLSIEANTAKPIAELASLLEHVPPARLWDESNKLFLAGHAFDTWHTLNQYAVIQHLLPETYKSFNDPNNKQFIAFINQALKNTDQRIHANKSVTPAFLFSIFLWLPMKNLAQTFIAKGVSHYEANQKAASKVFNRQNQHIAIPKRFSITIREIWELQFRLTNRRKRNVESLMQHNRFRAAYDFLCLSAGDDPKLSELAQWWTLYQESNSNQQLKMINDVSSSSHSSKKKKNSRKRSRHSIKRKPTNHDGS